MKERMNIVIVGHVDHGKSTLVGRLLADTNSLPQGKLEQVKRTCEINSKPFEYAFLLDALIDEQAQGITIDTARIFFKSPKREYIIIDAPGHIEFLKNMISGAARAEAAILLIDAHEGIAENSKRHAYMLSMLGIKQVVVAVNKMDLVNYDEAVFNSIQKDYTQFLNEIDVKPNAFVPLAALHGINITTGSNTIGWYNGPSILELIDTFRKEKEEDQNNFRMFVQGVYKFTADGDDRRIIAGTVNSGKINVGDEIIFLPSGKTSTVKSIEIYEKDSPSTAGSEEAIGITLSTQVYVKHSELIARNDETLPHTTDSFKANIFWMGKKPLQYNKKYKLKIGTKKVDLFLENIESVLDASCLEKSNSRKEIHRHEVAHCIFKTTSPFSFDLIDEIKTTSRFVIVDGYDIAGGGIIVEALEQTNTSNDEKGSPDLAAFEIELKNLIVKYFPHWDINI
ncbi:MAG: GTP-binding protein [Ignavibacteriales bacterium]|nr:GTP-binding protein [Ignavibacteriales bacterium]